MISILIPNASEASIGTTVEKCEHLFPEAQIIVATDRYRAGKGHALRRALSMATGDIIVFIDGDGDISPDMINRLLPHLNEFDIVVGTKDSRVRISRWILTSLSRIYISLIFGIPVDTQTGIKVFKRSHLPEWRENSFAFPLEILYKAMISGSKMFEVTVETRNSKPMKFKAIFLALIGSFKIHRRVKK